jgi:hypothetical protein
MVRGKSLALKIVAPNGLYGMRMAKTYSSPDLWYAGDRICGIYRTVASLAALILGIVLTRIAVRRGTTLGAVLAAIAIGVVAAIVHVQAL